MIGGETFVPKIPSMRITDLAEALAPGCERKVIGIRPGEKLHEVLITADESRHSYEQEGRYVIYPEYVTWNSDVQRLAGDTPPDGFSYTSENNESWLTPDEIREMASPVSPSVPA